MSKKQKPWREVLPVHEAADLFPLMSAEELRALADDIAKHGLREPVDIWRAAYAPMTLLDGRNRLNALELLGCEIFHTETKKGVEEIDWYHKACVHGRRFRIFQVETWVEDPTAYVVSKNIRRRHLTAELKRDLLAKLLKADPEKSDRQIATTVGVDHKTVGTVRREIEATGEIPQLTKTKGKDGKVRPARKKAPAPLPDEPEKPAVEASANPDAVANAGRQQPAGKSKRKPEPEAPSPARDPKTGELSAEANAANSINRTLTGFHAAFEAQLEAWLKTQPTKEGLEMMHNALGLVAEELYRMAGDVLARITVSQKAEADNATPADVAGEMMKAKFAATDDLSIPPHLRRLN